MRADTTGLLEAVTAGLGSGGAALADSIAQRAGKGKGARRAQSALTRAKGVQKMGQPGQIRGKGAVLGVHGPCAGRASDGPKGRKNTRSQFCIFEKSGFFEELLLPQGFPGSDNCRPGPFSILQKMIYN